MADQIQKPRPRKTQRVEESSETSTPTPVEHSELKDIDELLDEIDDVLETNDAAEFVRSFVQKGGE